MAEQAIITPEVEAKEGTVEAEIIKDAPEKAEDKKAPETVPLSVFLDLKEDLKNLKKEIKTASGTTKEKVRSAGVGEIYEKYPDVSPDFIQDILESATVEATKKIEEKYNPILERQDQEKKQAIFDKAFDNLFDKAIQDNPDLPKNIDKEAIKELAITPKYRNVPVADILLKMYGSTPSGRQSSENDMRSAADRVSDIVDFDKITSDQKKAIMDDPQARAKYFNWLDKKIG